MKFLIRKSKPFIHFLEMNYPVLSFFIWAVAAAFKRKPIIYLKFSQLLYRNGHIYFSRSLFDESIASLKNKIIRREEIYHFLEAAKAFHLYGATFEALLESVVLNAKCHPNDYVGLLPIVDLNKQRIPEIEKKILEEEAVYTFQLPMIYGEKAVDTIYEVPVPSHIMFTIPDAKIVGSFIIVKDEKLLVYEPAGHPANGFVSGNWEYLVQVGNRQDLALLNYSEYKKEFIEEGILISGRCSTNYYHWLIEYLPRLLTVNMLGINEKVPLIVQSTMYKQQFESLNALKGSRAIILFEENMVLNVKKLHVPSIPTYHPDRLDIEFWKGSTLSKKHLNFLREKVFQFYNINPTLPQKAGKKTYLSRRSSRAITNESEINELVKNFGFDIVYPELLSFHEQVKLFNESSVILGPAGAAFANTVFCRPGTIVLSFVSEQNKEYSMQANLARFSGAKYYFITGTPIVPRERCFSDVEFLHVNFTIDINKLESALNNLDSL